MKSKTEMKRRTGMTGKNEPLTPSPMVQMLVLAVVISLLLAGCGRDNSLYEISANGKKAMLSNDLQASVAALSEVSLFPYDYYSKKAFSEDGKSYKEISRSELLKTENIVEAQYVEGKGSTAEGVLGFASYGFYEKFTGDVSFPTGINISDTYEDALSKGYTDAGASVACLVVDGEQVSVEKYKDKAISYLMSRDSVSFGAFLEQNGYIKDAEDMDEYYRCISGGNIFGYIIGNYLALFSAFESSDVIPSNQKTSTPDLTPEEYYEYNKNCVNAYELYLAAIETGEAYRKGDVKSYAAIVIEKKRPSSGPDVQVNIAVDNAIIEKFRLSTDGE